MVWSTISIKSKSHQFILKFMSIIFGLSFVVFRFAVRYLLVVRSHTLYDPRFFTEHASLMLRPAGTVIFSMTSVNSGSSGKAAHIPPKEVKRPRKEKRSKNNIERNYEMNQSIFLWSTVLVVVVFVVKMVRKVHRSTVFYVRM